MSDDGYWTYAEVRKGTGSWLWSTEPAMVEDTFAELQRLIPSARVASSDRVYEKLGIREVQFDRLQGMDGVVGYAVVAILCKLGWEPLGGFEFRKRYNSANS